MAVKRSYPQPVPICDNFLVPCRKKATQGGGEHLGSATLVRRNIPFHTGAMNPLPTVIVMADPSADQPWARGTPDEGAAMARFSTLDTSLRRVLSSGLPMLLVAPQDQAEQAMGMLPKRDILVSGVPHDVEHRGDWMVRCLASAIMTRSHADGWLVLPADMPMLQASTLHALVRGLTQGPIVFPTYRHVRGHPVAFAAELYSELVRLDNEQGLRRLAARYPSVEVEVDDPGILMALQPHSDLAHLRAQLGGPALAHPPSPPYLGTGLRTG
jgi:molybdenum cofactor cytidylyltransferase